MGNRELTCLCACAATRDDGYSGFALINDMLDHFLSSFFLATDVLPEIRCIVAIEPPFGTADFAMDSHLVSGGLHGSGWMLEDGCTGNAIIERDVCRPIVKHLECKHHDFRGTTTKLASLVRKQS